MLQTSMSLGTLSGTVISSAADVIGRRMPLLLSYFGLGVFGIAASQAPTANFLFTMRFLMGIVMSLGQAPSRMLLCEFTPTKWQVSLGAGTQVAFIIGTILMLYIVARADPTLEHLKWRSLMVVATVPAIFFFVGAYFFVPESPVFLAKQRSRESRQLTTDTLRKLQKMNSSEPVDLDYSSPEESSEEHEKQAETFGKFGQVFSGKYRRTTLTFGLASVCQALFVVTAGFVAPQILGEASQLQPAYQLILSNCVGLVLATVSGKIGNSLSRAAAMGLSLSVMAACMITFAVIGSMPRPRPLVYSLAFQLSTFLPALCLQLGILIIYQVGAEHYPTNMASTGLSVIFALNKGTSIVGPILFENLRWATGGRWDIWYYLVAVVDILGAVAVLNWHIQQKKDTEEKPVETTSFGGLAWRERRRSSIGAMGADYGALGAIGGD
jgi:MFS family permease